MGKQNKHTESGLNEEITKLKQDVTDNHLQHFRIHFMEMLRVNRHRSLSGHNEAYKEELREHINDYFKEHNFTHDDQIFLLDHISKEYGRRKDPTPAISRFIENCCYAIAFIGLSVIIAGFIIAPSGIALIGLGSALCGMGGLGGVSIRVKREDRERCEKVSDLLGALKDDLLNEKKGTHHSSAKILRGTVPTDTSVSKRPHASGVENHGLFKKDKSDSSKPSEPPLTNTDPSAPPLEDSASKKN